MELRRRGWVGRTYDLVGDGPAATLELGLVREAGSVELADGVRLTVRRRPAFGAWDAIDASGTTTASATKHDAFRERFTVEWSQGTWRLVRRFGMGLRHLEVQDAAGTVVGRIRQRGVFGRVHDLRLPDAPGEVVALTAWIVAMLSQRDAAGAASAASP